MLSIMYVIGGQENRCTGYFTLCLLKISYDGEVRRIHQLILSTISGVVEAMDMHFSSV